MINNKKILKKIFFIVYTIFLLSFPSHILSQIKSDLMVDPDTTIKKYYPVSAFDENGNWQIV